MPVAEGLSRLRPDGNPRGAPTLKASDWQQDGLLQDVMQSSVREGAGSSSLKTSLQALTLSSEEGTGGPWPGCPPCPCLSPAGDLATQNLALSLHLIFPSGGGTARGMSSPLTARGPLDLRSGQSASVKIAWGRSPSLKAHSQWGDLIVKVKTNHRRGRYFF